MLLDVFGWTEDAFLRHTEGSAIRRIGHARWQRNVAVALGNALASDQLADADRDDIGAALGARRDTATPLLAEHIDWALAQRPAAPDGAGTRVAVRVPISARR
jgi:epoxyqueuosine reductase